MTSFVGLSPLLAACQFHYVDVLLSLHCLLANKSSDDDDDNKLLDECGLRGLEVCCPEDHQHMTQTVV